MIIPAVWMSALVYGAMITILCLGFTLTHMTAKIPNFAHGTYAGFGVYVTFSVVRMWGASPYIAFPIAILLGGVIGMILYSVVVATLRKMGGGAIVLTIFGYQGIFPISLAVCVVTVLALHLLLTKTNFGVAMRATSEDPMLASILGINTERIQLVSWAVTGAMACLAGAMLPLWFQGSPTAGGRLLTSTMAGSLLGGLENIYGAVIGGFGVGMVEILLTGWLMQVVGLWVGEYRPLIPMIIVIAVLLIQPAGISGAIERWRISRKSQARQRELELEEASQ
jgi:branched-chain amino acid transport system permease protein